MSLFGESLIERFFSYHIPLHQIHEKRVLFIIRNFVRRNKLLRYLYRWDIRKRNKGLGFFVIREGKPEQMILEKSLIYIRKSGFEILCKKKISKDTLNRLHLESNKQKKEKGNFWSGDYPYLCVVVFDPKPVNMYAKAKQDWPFWIMESNDIGRYYYRQFPNMDNRRLLLKNVIRVAINNSLDESSADNYAHTTDNFEEALEYIKIAIPEKIESIKSEIRARN